MSFKGLSIALLLAMYGLSLQAMESLQPAKKANPCLRGLAYMYKKLADVAQYPFRAIGSATLDGAWENARAKLQFNNKPSGVPISDGALPSLSQDEQLKEMVGSFFRALRDATDSKSKDAAGAEFMRNLFKNGAIAVGDLYNPDGEGREALKKIITTFKEFINEDGVIKDLIEDARTLAIDEVKILFERFEELNLDGGAAKRAVRATADNVRGGVENVGQAVDSTSKKLVRNVLVGGVLLMSSWFMWKHIDRTLRTPSLVLETSHKNYLQRLGGYLFGSKKKERPQMILSPELKERLNTVAHAARTIYEKIQAGQGNVRYRNLLLWGPPGTGKTMFARILAEYSGMDYVIMSGSSFSQYRHGEGIAQMNKLFEWANRTPRGGLLLLIDEAESFLGDRSGADISSDSYQLLTNFLNLTGERSNKIMIVFGTNHPEALDDAMKRRIDDAIELPLPAVQERADILKLYRDKLMLDPLPNTPEFIDSVRRELNNEKIALFASLTEGLSGGELEGIINSLISDASTREDGLLTQELIEKVVGYAVHKHESFTQGFVRMAST